MSSSSLTILHGNLGQDPEIFRTQAGFPIASFSVATKRRKKDENGNYVDVTDWHNCKALGKKAELVEQYMRKGSEVLIYGHNETREYDKNGEKRYTTEVIIDNLDFCGSAANGSGQSRKNNGNRSSSQKSQPNRGNQGNQQNRGGYYPPNNDDEIPY